MHDIIKSLVKRFEKRSSILFLFLWENRLFKDSILEFQNDDSYLWRHQFLYQWRYPKNFREGPFRGSSLNWNFDINYRLYMQKHKRSKHWFSQNLKGRSGNVQKVKKTSRGPISEPLTKILFSYVHITQSKVTERSITFLLYIRWLVTWLD